MNVQNSTYGLMEWDAPTRPNGYVFEYELTYRKLPQEAEVKKLRKSRYFVLKKLDTLASYQVTVLARNGVGRGPPLVEVFDLKSGEQRFCSFVKEINSYRACHATGLFFAGEDRGRIFHFFTKLGL